MNYGVIIRSRQQTIKREETLQSNMPRQSAAVSSHPALLEFMDWPAWSSKATEIDATSVATESKNGSGGDSNQESATRELTPQALLDAQAKSQSNEINAGLSAANASISPKYFYDHLGSSLFSSICHLTEYYPTRTEALIFNRYRQEIAAIAGTGGMMFDLGAADCVKAESWFEALKPDHYVAIDISSSYLLESLRRLKGRFPHMAMSGLGMDFSEHLDLPSHLQCDRPKFFYPGSSIGNFTPDQALAFLKRVRSRCGDKGQLLIGVDLVKSVETLVPAYDDALGVTAAFNLNALNQMNRLVGANFKLADWRHVALFNVEQSRIEMHLEALREVEVVWIHEDRPVSRKFAKNERIHTENSYKYQPKAFADLLHEAGFSDARFWTDDQRWFGVYLGQA
jgi:dimethylhistidine N-methyltransferase